MNTIEQPLLLRISSTARLAAVSRSRGYELAHSKWSAFTIKVGGSLRIVRTGLEEWIAAKLQEKADAATLAENEMARRMGRIDG